LAEINYSDEMHEQFGQALRSKIDGILHYDYEDFDKELYKKNCPYCEFNWFCTMNGLILRPWKMMKIFWISWIGTALRS